MKIIKKRKIWFIISGALVLLSLISLGLWSLNLGIDFTGGSLFEIQFSERPDNSAIEASLAEFDLGVARVQPTGDKNVILRFKEINEDTHQAIFGAIKEQFGEAEELRFESIGPVIGHELKRKSLSAILAVLAAIILYIAWAFRKVSDPIKSWKYGVVAVITLFHDVLIVMGIFAVLGKFLGVEIDVAFVAAILTILGYSVNDTIVVFDRIRENLKRTTVGFENIVNKSVIETVVRSVNTSLTTLLVLLAIYFFGGVTIKFFILALIFGVIIGTYSSIFLASPLLVAWERYKK